MIKPSYKDKLLDPRWQKRRLQILKRDKFTCQHCFDKTTTLHIHHFCYPQSGNPWESEDSEMITLCSNCHTYNHLRRSTPQIIQDLHTCLTINPKVNKEAIRLLVRLSTDYYK